MNAFVIQVMPWVIYVLFGYQFFSFISKHAVALYLTRGTPDGKRVRLFVQNLEDVALTGEFRLVISVPQEIEPDTLVIRAGPKIIEEDRSRLESGVWSIGFKRLPALDTWLFELDAPNELPATVSLTAIAAAPDSASKKDVDGSAGVLALLSKFLRKDERLPELATSSVMLLPSEADAVAGAEATPRFAAFLWVVVLALGLQYLATWTGVSSGLCQTLASWAADDKVACRSIAATFPSQVDVEFSALLLGLIVLSFLVCRRSPTPIAQGYLEKTKITPPAAAPPGPSAATPGTPAAPAPAPSTPPAAPQRASNSRAAQ